METNNMIVLGIVVLAVVLALVYKFRAPKQSKAKLSVELIETRQLTHDTIVFTFLLPPTHKKLGLKIGQHIEIEQNIKGQIVKRKYTPISTIDRIGSFELLLKIYRPTDQFPTGGKMSCFLADLPLHSKINFITWGNGIPASLISSRGNSVTKKYKNFYMVAGGTGITPIFQILQYCCQKQSQSQRPNLYLLFANRTEDDILMKQLLDTYAQKIYHIHIFYSVDRKITENWPGMVGFIDEEKVKKTIPDADEIKDTIFMSCGPPPLCNNVEKVWKGLGVTNGQIYRF